MLAWLDTPPGDLLDDVLSAKLDTGEDVDGDSPSVRRAVAREIAHAQRDIRDMVETGADGRIRVHRAITLTPDGLARLAPGDALGICWAFESRGAHAYDGKRDMATYVIKAWVEPGDLVADHTLAMWSSGEGEARLHRTGRVEIAAITVGAGLPVRPDLVGQEFGTGEPIPAAGRAAALSAPRP